MAKFHRIARLNLRQGMQGILTETVKGSVTGFVVPGGGTDLERGYGDVRP